MQNRFSSNEKGMPQPRHELKYFINDAAHATLSSLLGGASAREERYTKNNSK